MEKIVDIVSSKAWVDMMPIQPTPGGTLHVAVEINGNGRKASLVRKEPQGINPMILMLEIKLSLTDQYVENPQHLKYTEGLQSTDQYTSIEVYYEADMLAEITD